MGCWACFNLLATSLAYQNRFGPWALKFGSEVVSLSLAS